MSSLELRSGAVASAVRGAVVSRCIPPEERGSSAREKFVGELYQDHAIALRKFARRKVGREDSEDMVQEAYLRLLQDEKVAQIDCPRAYLFRVASNLAVDARRRSMVRTRFVDDAAKLLGPCENVSNPQAAFENLREVQKLRAFLDRLSPLCRDIFLLARVDGLNSAEIAARVGVSIRTVERQSAKARSGLRLMCGR